MDSPIAEKLQNPLYHSTKNNPFRKSNNFFKAALVTPGSESPDSLGTKRTRTRSNVKVQPVNNEQVTLEEGLNIIIMPDQEGARGAFNQSPIEKNKEDFQQANNMSLPAPFGKYMLTTDVPFSGIRTTKTRIEPVRSFDYMHKLNPNGKDEFISSLVTPKRPKVLKSKSKIISSQSKVLVGGESKPSVDRPTKRNPERDSMSNGERESMKQDSPTRNSIDEENDAKEKAAFLTESPMSPAEKLVKVEVNHDPSDSDDEENPSEQSEEKNKEKVFKQIRSPKKSENQKQKYDPEAILEKIRRGEPLVPRYSDNLFVKNNSEGTLSNRDDLSHKAKRRDFIVVPSRKMHLFEGIPYVPYDIFLRQDVNMQNVMVKDLLKILLDKAKSLKNLYQDGYRMDRIMRNIEEGEQYALNSHTEETIGLINAVATLILQEFRDSVEKIGIKQSPIFDNPNIKLEGFNDEIERFGDNCTLFVETIDHLRDCIDCYNVMSRQKDRKPMPDSECSDLLQFIARARYNLGQLYEAFRIIEKHVDARIAWRIENDPNRTKEKIPKTEAPQDNKLRGEVYKLLNELLHNKFNNKRNKLAATRESKAVLNQEAEDEKFLLILQNQKQLKKKDGKVYGDNRKLIILNRLLNPIEDPQIQAAIKVAQEKTHVQLSRDLVEYMASKAKNVNMKTKVRHDLPLKNNLDKILENKKLTEFYDVKEPQDILDRFSSKAKSLAPKRDVNETLNRDKKNTKDSKNGKDSHDAKTKRHLACLFDKEAATAGPRELCISTSTKGFFRLPKLQDSPKHSSSSSPHKLKPYLQTR